MTQRAAGLIARDRPATAGSFRFPLAVQAQPRRESGGCGNRGSRHISQTSMLSAAKLDASRASAFRIMSPHNVAVAFHRQRGDASGSRLDSKSASRRTISRYSLAGSGQSRAALLKRRFTKRGSP